MKLRGTITHAMFPQYSWCLRCKTTWNLVESRSVNYIACSEEQRRKWWIETIKQDPPPRYKDYPTSGIFALCTECWDQLTPQERLVYYEELWHMYDRTHDGRIDQHTVDLSWEEIQTRILQEMD
jgi:hypothetical protein